MSFNGIQQFAAILSIMKDTRHVLLGGDNQDIRLGQLLDEAKECVKDRVAEETMIESPTVEGAPDPDPGPGNVAITMKVTNDTEVSERRRVLGKSKDGRTLRSIANTARELTSKDTIQALLHAIADRLDRREAFMETVAASMKAIDEGDTTPIQEIIDDLEGGDAPRTRITNT